METVISDNKLDINYNSDLGSLYSSLYEQDTETNILLTHLPIPEQTQKRKFYPKHLGGYFPILSERNGKILTAYLLTNLAIILAVILIDILLTILAILGTKE